MRLLLDEQIIGYAVLFRAKGWEAISVDDIGMRRTEDEIIVNYAKENGYAIITSDRKMKRVANLADVKCYLIEDEKIVSMVDRELKADS